jgi:hypothetical protein
MSYYNEYAIIPTRTPKTEQYYTLNQIPKPTQLGFDGDYCNSNLNCHTDLMCQQNKCGQFIPKQSLMKEDGVVVRGGKVKERFQSVPGDDFYKLSPDYEDFPITTKTSTDLQYTSKYKSKSGRNYY